MNENNNVHLRWNKHQATLVSVFDCLLDSEKLTDCTISAEGHHVRAHKIILSACSPYFEKLFSENYEKHPIIILHDVKYNVVKALMDFMYRGEVNVPQEELSGILKLSESLQVRGLSGSGCVEDVYMQKGSGRNAQSVHPETLSPQPASVSRFTSNQNKPEEKVQSFRESPPCVSSQEGGYEEIDSISKSFRKYRKSINHSGSDQRTGQNEFEEVITPYLDNVHQLQSQRQALPTICNAADGSVFSPIPHQSACSELQSSSGEMTVAENERFLIPETVLPDKRSANLSTHQQEVALETKSEVLESHTEIVEDLTLDDDDDDDDYLAAEDYREDCNSTEVDIGEVCRAGGGLTYEEYFRAQGVNNLRSSFGSDYSNHMTSTTPQMVLHKRFCCQSCGKSYKHPSGLCRHVKLECGKEPQIQCPRCNYRCFRSHTLKKHMTTRRCQMREKCALFEGGV
ncbi:longitudinals lacking protein-like isoform X6 [Schistocerca piceifrons]|uniref:longitudinals lacking protein-like isoform X6 n=1 Tax=Schistocerca piceifrons TaxID=274613 RepID=UPI001F5F44D4|nr:longitudinals lacking protein-like isoform X6 [Schistocerca piceifrons]